MKLMLMMLIEKKINWTWINYFVDDIKKLNKIISLHFWILSHYGNLKTGSVTKQWRCICLEKTHNHFESYVHILTQFPQLRGTFFFSNWEREKEEAATNVWLSFFIESLWVCNSVVKFWWNLPIIDFLTLQYAL